MHEGTFMALYNLALVLHTQGGARLFEAEEVFQQALRGQDTLLGSDHRSTLKTKTSLALCLQSLGKLDEAGALFEEALAAQKESLGSNHLDTLHSMASMANLLKQKMERLDEAEVLLRKVVAGREAQLGPENASTVSAVDALSGILYERGKVEEAVALGKWLLYMKDELQSPKKSGQRPTLPLHTKPEA
jgi:tetratricopeptide (TPR) repeat protein